jgi:AcrR family transcriptional regulator
MHDHPSTAERLLAVALDSWERRGHAGTSARLVAQAAGQPVSSIYYHFGDLEHLLITSQNRAIDLARDWCMRQLDAIPTRMEPVEAMPPLLAALIQNWSIDHRQLAFAWRECQLVAARNDSYLPALHGWNELWTGFWEEICRRCGVPGLARLHLFLFDGESFLHLIRGEPVVDYGCLFELCRGWGDWLAGRPAVEGPWRRHAREAAEQAAAMVRPEGAIVERIAAAAADLLASDGLAGLTHRGVAAAAGLTLGAVSYHCRTSADLIQIAFETVYQRAMRRDPAPAPVTIRSRRDYEEYRQRTFGQEESQAAHLGRLALHELLVAVARGVALKGFAAQLRYLRGRTSRHHLARLLGPDEPVSPLEAALLSDVSFGRSRGYIGLSPAERAAARLRDVEEIDRLVLATRQA